MAISSRGGHEPLTRVFLHGDQIGRVEEARLGHPARRGLAWVEDQRLIVEKDGGGVERTTIVPERDVSTWGILVEVSDARSDELRRLLDAPAIEITVHRPAEERRPEEAREARSRSFVRPTREGTTPSADKAETTARELREAGLPPAFVEHVRRMPHATTEATGLLVVPRRRLGLPTPGPAVQLSRAEAKRLGLGRTCVVVVNGRAVPAAVLLSDVRGGCCALDQSLRQALGFDGPHCFGARVELRPVRGSLRSALLFRSRSLVLPLHRTVAMDSEKNLCVLHPRTIALLGMTEGESVEILAAAPAPRDGSAPAGWKLRKIHRRVSAGAATSVRRDGVREMDYPQLHEVYLDAEGRHRLGLTDAHLGQPLHVRPSLRRMLEDRALYYLVAFFLGLDAILTLMVLLWPKLTPIPANVLVPGSIGIFVLLAGGLALLDIRRRVRW